jgi:hypothetical protein
LAIALALIFISTFTLFSYAQTAQTMLTRHVPQVVVNGKAPLLGQLSANQIMRFDIVIPLRDQTGLDIFLQQLYDPSSIFYHQFITPEEFTARFGPSEQDWEALVNFAKASGFQIFSGTRDERDLRVTGTVANIEQAFHITLGVYQDPNENRTFFSPDREPSVDLPFPLWHVSGLDNYIKKHSMLVNKYDFAKKHGMNPDEVVKPDATTGSGPSASFLGSDMRHAYYCNGTCGSGALTGTGQTVALFEYEGTDLSDLTLYYKNAGQTEPFTPTVISVDGTSTTSSNDIEQTLDMTQAMGMAPGLTMLYMYVGSTDTAILSAMVATTDAPLSKQIGCSWGWTADVSTLNPYFQQMGTQDQNFFAASGDSGYWHGTGSAAPWPADDAYIVGVGGTDLTTSSAAGPWASETAWVDSGGGITTNSIPIPSWQQISGVINSSNAGSTTLRNGPDVSANANFTFYTCGGGSCTANLEGGTSFAAPMWAGYLALANQQAAANGEPIGFINPTIYPAGVGSTYSTIFHDVTGNSNGKYTAVTGYDLVTGWGSPNGSGLINLLAPTGGLTAQTITFTTSAPSSAAYNSTFSVAATASSGLTVAFTASGSCSVVDHGTGSATYTMTSGTGTCSVIANQAGNATYAAAPTVTQTTNATTASQTITFTTNAPASEVYLGQFTVAATATSGLTVTFTSSGSCTNSGATYTMTSGTGTCSVIANQAGNTNYAAAPTNTQTTNATPASQTITFTTNAPSSAAYGQSFTVAATGGPSGNPVLFTSAGSCNNSGAIYTMTSGTGTCSVIANQAGNSNYAAATQVTQSTNATLATSSVSVGSSQNPAFLGQSVTFTATINGQFGQVKGNNGSSRKSKAKPEVVTGSVTWSSNTGCGSTTVTSGVATCTTSTLPMGTDTITGTYSGDSNHSGGTGTLTGGEVINQYGTSTAVASTLDPATYGQSVSFTANVTSSGGTPTGTVQFNVDGLAFGSPVTLSSGSAASGSTSTLAVGAHTVTAVYSGASNYAASTGMLAGGEVVNSATAATTVASSQNPTNYGQSVTFTATINGEYGLVKGRKGASKKPLDVTGNVTWSANTGCGTTAVTSGNPGTASCTTSTLPVGSDTITATYSGDGNHSGSTGTLTGGQVVNQWSTSTAVGSSLNPSVYGQAVSFTANVTSSGGTPTGTVQFNVDGIAFGTPVTLSSGSATSTSTSTLAVGTHTVTAAYSGATNYTASTGTLSGGEVVNSATAAMVVASSLNPSAFNQSVTFTATINGEYGLVKGRKGHAKPEDVTGSVNWSSNTGCSTTTVASGNPGTATCTTSSLPVGTSTITATYSGDSNHSASTATLSGGQVVDQAPATTAVTSSLNPATYGQSVSFTANVTSAAGTPTGTVQFNVDGNLFDTETLASGSATSTSTSTLAVGTHTVTAVYSGDTNFPPSTGTLSGGEVVKSAAAATVVTSSLNPSTFNQSVTFTATINGQYGLVKGRKGAKPEAVTGTVAWSSNTGCGTTTVTSGNPGLATCTTSTLVSGTDTITAAYSGDSNHSGSTGTLSQTVSQATTTTAVASSLNPSTTGQAVSFTANVTSTAGTPAGTVQFSIDGTAFGSPVTLASGSATSGTTSALSAGTHTITAVYSGAANYAASTGTLSGGQVVNPVQSQTITFNPNPPSSAAYNTSFTVAATASSGLPVAFTSTGSCTNVGATYTVNSGSGTCFVIANQAGNAQYSPAPQVTAQVTAVPASQTIAVTVAAPPTATYKSSFTVAASASSGLAVTYSSAGSCTNSGATYTITKSSGTCTGTITQAGNSNYAAATPVVQHTTVAAAIAPTVSLTAPATAVYGSTYTVVATTNASTTPTITAAPVTVCTISGTTVTMVNGTGTCTVTAKWAADDVYKAATATAKTIAQKAATVLTWPTPAPITYGTPLSSTQLDASASYNSSPLPGTYVYSPAAGTVPKVGTCDTLNVTFTPTQSTDFTRVTASVCLQVNAAK